MQRIQAEDENPMKCAFGVTYGKFLGYLVNRQGMNVDPAKAKAVLDMPEPTSAKKLKSFLGKASYLRRFLPGILLIGYFALWDRNNLFRVVAYITYLPD